MSGLPGVGVYQDDIVIAGSDVKEHDEHLDSVLKIIKDYGLKLNKSKCIFRTKPLKFLGHIFEKDGMSPDVAKVKAVQNMPVPNNVTELRRILGMIHYLGAYLPKLATVIQPMNELLHKDTAWSWGPTQEKSFNEVKCLLTSAPVLQYFMIQVCQPQ